MLRGTLEESLGESFPKAFYIEEWLAKPFSSFEILNLYFSLKYSSLLIRMQVYKF